MTATRTTHRSTANTKLYAKRTPTGRFKDVQTHKRASRQDQRVTTVAEATRVLVREARQWRSYWWSPVPHRADRRLCKAVDSLNAATRAAAARKRRKV